MPGPFREVLLPESEFWEACARHSNRATTRNISVLFLCDACVEVLTHQCFNGRPPIYHGESFHGYCGLCNRLTTVTLRQWFICPICLNVVLGYPKSVAATQFVRDFWKTEIEVKWPALKLSESDVVQIEPFVPGKRSQKAKAITVEALDFLAQRQKGDSYEAIFHIEMKTGPSSISEMREFQLDVNDFDDIKTVVTKTGLPAYVFHVQVVEDYRLPTRRSVAKGMWWADIVSLRRNLKAVRRRRGEDKDAGYYEPSVFLPLEGFIEEIKMGRYRELAERIRHEGLEDLPSRQG